MRTIIITHTDWSPNPNYVRQPYTDNGRFEFTAQSPDAWANVWYELGSLARVNCAAMGCRGTYDPGGVNALAVARRAYDATTGPKPTITFWCDTVGLPDITHNLFGSPFDFANARHIDAGLEHFFRHFFDNWKTAPLELLDGELVMPWWGWAPPPGSHGWLNNGRAQNLLDAVTAYARQQVPGLRGVKHIVASGAFNDAPGLRAYGAHNWFNPWMTPPQANSIEQRGYGNVAIACVVPGYSDPNRPLPERIPASADVAHQGLSRATWRGCMFAILEGACGFIEGIEWIRPESGDTSKLQVIWEFSEPYAEQPEPEDPIMGETWMAVSNRPVLEYVSGVLVRSPLDPNRFALRWTQPSGNDRALSVGNPGGGYPDPTSRKYLCPHPDGRTEAKDTIGDWESSQPVKEGDVEIRWFTENAGKDQSYCIAFARQTKELASL